MLRYGTIEGDLVLRRAFIVACVAGASLIAMFLLAELVVGSSFGAVGGGLVVALLACPFAPPWVAASTGCSTGIATRPARSLR
jgi:hypothetical protein